MSTYNVKTIQQEVEKTISAIKNGETERTTKTMDFQFETLKDAINYIVNNENNRHFHFYHTLIVDNIYLPESIANELIKSFQLTQKIEMHRQNIHANIDKLDIFNQLKFTSLI